MSKNAYKAEGDFQMGRMRQHFVLEVAATDEEDARHHVYADLGSRHGVPRRLIDIESVTKVAADDAHPVTRHRMRE